jgi:hypothetical protein
MSTEDKAKLRSISFREFADEWLDKLNNKYDPIGDLWIDLFREDITKYLNNISNRIDALLTFIQATGADEAYEAFVSEFTEGEKKRLPAYELLLPIIRALGGQDEDSALTIISIFEYARARRLGGAAGDNLPVD